MGCPHRRISSRMFFTFCAHGLIIVMVTGICFIHNTDQWYDQGNRHISLSTSGGSRLTPANFYQSDIISVVQRKLINSSYIGKSLTVINPHPYIYINNPLRCRFQKSDGRNVMIIVKSTVRNVRLRQAIRTTWGNLGSYASVRLVFTLGYNNSVLQKVVDEEATRYNDIVQENFTDAYLNNTLKTIMSFNWAAQFCKDAEFLLFLDDDFVIDLPKILKYIYAIPPGDAANVFMGYLLDRPVDRGINSKWYVSWEQYPYEYWPHYLAGGAFIASMQVVMKFSFAFPYIKLIGIDDAWLGIVAKHVQIYPQDHYFFHNYGRYSHMAFVHQCCHTEEEMLKVWWQFSHNASFRFGAM